MTYKEHATEGNKGNFFIISSSDLCGNTAASSRVMNYARSITHQGGEVYIAPCLNNGKIKSQGLRNLHTFNSNFLDLKKKGLFAKNKLTKGIYRIIRPILYLRFFTNLFSYISRIEGSSSIILYPVGDGFFAGLLFLFSKMTSVSLFCEVNEIRMYALRNRTIPTSMLRKMTSYYLRALKVISARIEESVYRRFDGLICISTSIQAKYQSNNTIRIPTLVNPNSVEKNKTVPSFCPQTESFRICYTGSLNPRKEGFQEFFNAVSHLVDENFNIEINLYGYGSHQSIEETTRRLPSKYNIESFVSYRGYVEQENIIRILQKHHLLILPRATNPQTKFGFSTKLAEYMISGIPVLATGVSDNALFVVDGVNGFLVKPNSTDFTKKLAYIIATYNILSPTISRNSYETAVTKFNPYNYSQYLYAFLTKTASKSNYFLH